MKTSQAPARGAVSFLMSSWSMPRVTVAMKAGLEVNSSGCARSLFFGGGAVEVPSIHDFVWPVTRRDIQKWPGERGCQLSTVLNGDSVIARAVSRL